MVVEFDNARRTYRLGSDRYDWGAYMLNDLFEFLQKRRTHAEIREQLEKQWQIICDRRKEEREEKSKDRETPISRNSGSSGEHQEEK